MTTPATPGTQIGGYGEPRGRGLALALDPAVSA